ncbi:MAG: GNAT family N-acetyltransferase [Rhodobacteraceae bacterium]|nr:GNAT family N-acetyltransferase [Paracoccaceae bacterium]
MAAKFGEALTGWVPPAPPADCPMDGHYVRLERLSAVRHAADLFAANRADDRIWDYMPYGPFAAEGDYRDWVASVEAGADPLFFALIDRATGKAAGVASYLRITPASGSVEIGHINLAPALQRGRAATETMYLMMARAFAGGYRRFEWKCDALNLPSRRAALRLGFSYEGIFRQATVYKGRNRDTAWFAVIDKEWPALKAAFERWLDPTNFDGNGRQRQSLSDLTRPLIYMADPGLTG